MSCQTVRSGEFSIKFIQYMSTHKKQAAIFIFIHFPLLDPFAFLYFGNVKVTQSHNNNRNTKRFCAKYMYSRKGLNQLNQNENENE